MSENQSPELDLSRLDAFIRSRFDDLKGELSVARTEGGMSNPTYVVRYENRSMVLRKQPSSVLVPSAHAIDREYRVLGALRDSPVPVPRVYLYCDDRGIVGTPFYLMEHLQGRVFHHYATPGLLPSERCALFDAMAQTMAKLHRLDFARLGLADYGRPGNYFARQLGRWSQLWQQYRNGSDDNPDLDHLILWLGAHLPNSETLALCHGDFRIGNLMFDAHESKVIGVLDWELSTLGHPLVDVAFNSQAWRMAPDENGGLLGLPIAELGIPDEDAYLEQYYRYAKSNERMTRFHQAFAMFRGAVGSAGVAVRGLQGNSVLPDSTQVGRKLALAYAQRGAQLINP